MRIVRTLFRTFGCKGLTRRGLHESRRLFNRFRAAPTSVLAASHYEGPRIYSSRCELSALPAERLETVLVRGRRVAEGSYEAYGCHWRTLPQIAAEWCSHPVSGHEFPVYEWWRIDTLAPGADIKDVWEPARFGWVYDLVRAYAVTRDRAYAEAFHIRLAAWRDANPPFRGVHWACGQEVAIRAIAILHAMDSLPLPEGRERAAEQMMLEILGWSGERIADAIGYGLSQRNNHGLSEAAGLLHIALRLRGLHPEANEWLRRGRRFLEEQTRDQFSPDGWYAQHSFTYMRVALEQLVLAQQAMRAYGMTLSHAALELLSRAFDLLVHLVDAHTGYVPNHGANDGGRVAPLSTAVYRDFRPILTQVALVLGLPLPADVPADPQIVLWFGGSAPPAAPARTDGLWTGSSGWAVARVAETMLFLRAGEYRHRPSHLDALHLDVRFGHAEAITDPGTFAYNAPPPWKNPLTSAAVHNGPILDGIEPGERGVRFLWYSWPCARLIKATYLDGRALLIAEVPQRVRRVVEVAPGKVRVSDLALDSMAAQMQVTWLLHPDQRAAEVVIEDGSAEPFHGVEGDVGGWFSPTYGLRMSTTSIRVRQTRSSNELRLTTVIRQAA